MAGTLPASFVEISDSSPSGELFFGQGKVTGTRIAEVAYADVMQAVRYLLGSIVIANGQEIISQGDAWPGFPQLTAQTVRVRPMGKTGNSDWPNSLPYSRARLTIEYSTPTWGNSTGSTSPENELTLVQSLDYSCEILTVPVKATDGSNVKTEKRSFRIPTITYTAEIPRVRQPSFATINNLNGKVNTVAVFGGAAGTVLFDGPKLRQEITGAGDYAWNCVFKFIYNRFGWNKQLHPETLAWVPVAAVSGGNLLYETADLRDLWKNSLL